MYKLSCYCCQVGEMWSVNHCQVGEMWSVNYYTGPLLISHWLEYTIQGKKKDKIRQIKLEVYFFKLFLINPPPPPSKIL